MSVARLLRRLLVLAAVGALIWWLLQQRKKEPPFELFYEQPPDLGSTEEESVEEPVGEEQQARGAEVGGAATVVRPPSVAMSGKDLGLPPAQPRPEAGEKQDLTRIRGIGPTFASRLYEHGITTFRALAEATAEQLAEICQAPAWRMPDYASWIEQARELADGSS